LNSERILKEFLGKYKLSVERFSKEEMKAGKTPDYKVFFEGQLSFYCEVKNSEKDRWLDDLLDESEPGRSVGGSRNDPIFNRLTGHIHKATKQFNAVNSDEKKPNVLAFHNEDKNAGFLDLLAVTTGNFFAEDGSVLPFYKNFSEGRVKRDIERIHLFIWLDEFKPYKFLFNTINARYQSELCRTFGFDPDSLDLVHS